MNVRELRRSTNFTVKKYPASVYMGEENKENNKREGRGIMVYRNGRVFEGSWLNDMREGKG